MRVSLNWLKDFVEVKDGLEKARAALTMTGLEIVSVANVEGDSVMDIEVTPNRPDCLSILGIARELSAAIGKPVALPETVRKNLMKKGPGKGSAKIEVADKHACPRYVGCIIKNVKVGPSPKWLASRLNALGVRSINNVVDVTNYVLFELGQPLHAFDLDKLEGKRIIVRHAKKGEGIMTIDNVQRTLDSNTLVIADLNKPVAIAGIMGGKATEVSEETKNVLLEAAVFDPIIIRKACRQLSLASESSYRFERGIDQGMVLSASVRAQQLIREIAGGRTAGAITDIGVRPAREKELSLEIKEVKRVLGVEIDVETIKEIFRALDFSPLRKKDKMHLKIPSYRSDIDRDVDLIEEIARLYGYEKIPVKEPLFTPHKAYHLEKKTDSMEREVRHVLCSLGLNEIVTYSLASRSAVESLGIAADSLVRLQNPLSSEQEFMRPSLLSEMLEVVSWNLNRKNALLELFELNKVYIKGSDPAIQQEKLNLSIGMCGNTSGNWKNKAQEIDFFDLKGVVETLLASLGVKGYSFEKAQSPLFKDAMSTNIIVSGKVFGVMGETRQETARKFDIKKRVYMSEIFIEDLLGLVNLKKTFASIPRYPAVKRDIALLVDDAVPASGIYNLIKEEARGMARSIEVFDLYKGQQVAEGKKSLAYSIEYRSDEKTLKDEEVNEAHKKVQDALVKKLGAQLR